MTRSIVSDPEVMGGIPCFEGTRVPVYVIADCLADGYPEAAILDDYPDLTAEDIQTAWEWGGKQG